LIQFSLNGKQVAKTFEFAGGPRMVAALTEKINALDVALQRKIQTEKLSGQVLTARSGKLRDSIRALPVVESGTDLVGEVKGAGGVAPYGRVHEYGGRGPYTIVPVKAKALRFMVGGKVVFARMVNHPPLARRSFMRVSLEEMAPEIVAGLRATVAEVIGTT